MAEKKPLSTTTTLQFTAPDTVTAESSLTEPIELQNWVYDVPENTFAVKMTPSVDAKLYASSGSIQYFKKDIEDVPPDFIVVNGESSFQRPKGVAYTLVWSILHPDSTEPLTLTDDAGGVLVTANQKFWGMVRVDGYTREYRILIYTPDQVRLQLSLSSYDPLGNLNQNQFGTIAAFYKDQVSTLFIVPQARLDDELGTDEIEIYRITSKALVNEEGEWEYPPGWPTDTSYPSGATPEPEPEIGMVIERVHEIGYVNAAGSVWTRTQTISKAQPMTSVDGYVPEKSITEVALPDTLPPYAKQRAQEALAKRRKGVL